MSERRMILIAVIISTLSGMSAGYKICELSKLTKYPLCAVAPEKPK